MQSLCHLHLGLVATNSCDHSLLQEKSRVGAHLRNYMTEGDFYRLAPPLSRPLAVLVGWGPKQPQIQPEADSRHAGEPRQPNIPYLPTYIS